MPEDSPSVASAEFARELATEVDTWTREGIVTPEQARRIAERYAGAAETGGRSGWIASALYATAGVLLGAAAIAFVLVGLNPTTPETFFLLSGAILLAGGVALHVAAPDRALLADALLVAGLVPLTLSAMGERYGPVGGIPALVAPVAILVARRSAGFAPPLATLAANVALAIFVSNALELATGTPWWLWALGQAVLVGGILALERQTGENLTVASVVATGGLAVSFIPTMFDLFPNATAETVEVLLGVVYLGILGIGVGLKARGVLLAGSVALAIDAIVFAFDVGGALVGTGTLVALAALLVLQAEALKRWFSKG